MFGDVWCGAGSLFGLRCVVRGPTTRSDICRALFSFQS